MLTIFVNFVDLLAHIIQGCFTWLPSASEVTLKDMGQLKQTEMY